MYAEMKAQEAEARGDHARAAYWRRIKAKVDEAPLLTPAQVAQLRILLAPQSTGSRDAA